MTSSNSILWYLYPYRMELNLIMHTLTNLPVPYYQLSACFGRFPLAADNLAIGHISSNGHPSLRSSYYRVCWWIETRCDSKFNEDRQLMWLDRKVELAKWRDCDDIEIEMANSREKRWDNELKRGITSSNKNRSWWDESGQGSCSNSNRGELKRYPNDDKGSRQWQ